MIHVMKLAVGIRDIAHLRDVQQARAEARGDLTVRRAYTRNKPVRPDADEGSMYWVIQGVMRCRQKLLGFETELDAEGKRYCLFLLDPEIVPLVPTRKSAFQGWRYLEPQDAPPDLVPGADGEPPPDEMLRELRSLGLI